MKRALLLLWVGLLAAWAQSNRGLLVVFDSAQNSQSIAHKELVELLRQKRAEGHFAGTGLESHFQIYDFAEPQMAATLKRMGISRNRTYLCLTQLDRQDRPVKVLWGLNYTSPEQALAALDGQLGLSSGDTPSPTPSPTTTPVSDQLSSGGELPNGGYLESHSGHYRFVVQADGNCVLYRVDGPNLAPLWATQTHGNGVLVSLDGHGKFRVMQGNQEIWSTRELESGFYQLQVQDDGNFVMYRCQGNASVPVWSVSRSQ
jgi:hypothetical protein